MSDVEIRMSAVETVQAIYDAFGRITRFFHCIDGHAVVLAYGL